MTKFSSLFLPNFQRLDQMYAKCIEDEITDSDQRLLKKGIKLPPIKDFSDTLERIKTVLKEKRSIELCSEKIPNFNGSVKLIKVEFILEELLNGLEHSKKYGEIHCNIFGSFVKYLLGEGYYREALKLIYGDLSEELINEEFIKGIKKFPRDCDYQIGSDEIKDGKSSEVLHDLLEGLAKKIKGKFSSSQYLDHLQTTGKIYYNFLNEKEEEKIKIYTLQEFLFTKYLKYVDGINRLSMFGFKEESGLEHDLIVADGEPGKYCVNSRDACKIALEKSLDEKKNGEWIPIIASTSNEIDLAQVFHDQNLNILHVPDLKKIDERDWLNLIFLGGNHTLVQEIEKTITLKTAELRTHYLSRQMGKKDPTFLEGKNAKTVLVENQEIDYFVKLLKKHWKNHGKGSIVPFLFNACRNLHLYLNISDKDLSLIWRIAAEEEKEKGIEEKNPLYKLIKELMIKKKVTFSELFIWMQNCLFFNHSVLSIWQKKPIYRSQNFLVTCDPVEALFSVQKKIWPEILNNSSKKKHFEELALLIISQNDTEQVYPSPWIPYLPYLNLSEEKITGMHKIATTWVQDKDPLVSSIGVYLALAIPAKNLEKALAEQLLCHLPKSFNFLASKPVLILNLIKKLKLGLEASEIKISLNRLEGLFERNLNPPFYLLVSVWIECLAHSHSSLAFDLIQEFRNLLSSTLEENEYAMLKNQILFRLLKEKDELNKAISLIQQIQWKPEDFIETLLQILNKEEKKNHLEKVLELVRKGLEMKIDQPSNEEMKLLSQFSKKLADFFKELYILGYQFASQADQLLILSSRNGFLLPQERSSSWLDRLENLWKNRKLSLFEDQISLYLYRLAFRNKYLGSNEKKMQLRLKNYQKEIASLLNGKDISQLDQDGVSFHFIEILKKVIVDTQDLNKELVNQIDLFLLREDLEQIFGKKISEKLTLSLDYLAISLDVTNERPYFIKVLWSSINWVAMDIESTDFNKGVALFKILLAHKLFLQNGGLDKWVEFLSSLAPKDLKPQLLLCVDLLMEAGLKMEASKVLYSLSKKPEKETEKYWLDTLSDVMQNKQCPEYILEVIEILLLEAVTKEEAIYRYYFSVATAKNQIKWVDSALEVYKNSLEFKMRSDFQSTSLCILIEGMAKVGHPDLLKYSEWDQFQSFFHQFSSLSFAYKGALYLLLGTIPQLEKIESKKNIFIGRNFFNSAHF